MNKELIKQSVATLIDGIEEDGTREGLADTPNRVAKFWDNWIKYEMDFNMTTFKNEGTDQMIIQTQIPFYSICEHHLLPFFGTACVAYIPKDRIVGLSKLARLVQNVSSRPQNQERITTLVANALQENLSPVGVGVMLEARHLCMEMRGVRAYGTKTTTSCLLGNFKEQKVKEEFFILSRK